MPDWLQQARLEQQALAGQLAGVKLELKQVAVRQVEKQLLLS